MSAAECRRPPREIGPGEEGPTQILQKCERRRSEKLCTNTYALETTYIGTIASKYSVLCPIEPDVAKDPDQASESKSKCGVSLV